MKEELMEILCCPVDKHELELTVDSRDDEEILSAPLAVVTVQTVFRTPRVE